MTKIMPPDDQETRETSSGDDATKSPSEETCGDFTLIRDEIVDDVSATQEPRESKEPAHHERIGRYRIERLLGRGGFGSVYLARDEQLDRLVAIKIAHNDLIASHQDASIYLEEARNVAKLDHPHIVPVHDVGSTPEVPFYFVSKFIDGSNLSMLLRESNVNHYAAAKIAATIAEALQHTHRNGLIHRDVKPGNILIDRSGESYLVDFGLALSEDSNESEPRYVGTPLYTSPEQARGEGHRVDGRSDVFSLGVVLYELLTGRRPFRGSKRSHILQQVTSYEPRPPRQYDESIPKPLDRICQKAMSKLACDRYQSAFDLAEDLKFFLAANEPAAATPGLRESDSNSDTERNRLTQHSDRTKVASDRGSQLSDEGRSNSESDSKPTSEHVGSESSTFRQLAIVPKGIRSFDAHDSDFYLELIPGARDRDGLPESIRFWKSRIEDSRRDKVFSVGLIYGPSGCGKSSLVQAGLIPRLSKQVQSVFVESTSDDTENRLLQALRSKCPTLPRDRSLVDMIKMIRNGYGPSMDTKILIVLDQFEQWLHAHSSDVTGSLVQALRQCDGIRVQAILMVRDDFWMATTAFMRELEVRISEGQNASAVDLFPVRHAIKVLDAYGRAFGNLPKPPERLTDDQSNFLKLATEQLARDGKVICVRLSLFAEIMKSRPWSVASLREVGGAQGVGLKFLEETFDGQSAPLSYRYHADAARAALKELLPDPGQSHRGHSRTVEEINKASGYSPGSKDFSELLTILDTEVRLITPCDVDKRIDKENGNGKESEPNDGQRSYQLTHDYLVGSLRSWLTQKQRETKQGRAELLLSERASVWSSKQENRHLPTLSEDVRIRWLTDRNQWNEKERSLMAQGKRVHSFRVLLATVAVALLAFTGIQFREHLQNQRLRWDEEAQQRDQIAHSQALVSGLATTDINRIDDTLLLIEPLREWVNPLIEQRLETDSINDSERLRLSLAMLPADPGQFEYLGNQLPNLKSDEFQVVLDALSPEEELSQQLWATAQDEQSSESQRFQAACALAEFAPEDTRWSELAPLVVECLTSNDSLVPPTNWRCELTKLPA